jgi:hypothetical protein
MLLVQYDVKYLRCEKYRRLVKVHNILTFPEKYYAFVKELIVLLGFMNEE